MGAASGGRRCRVRTGVGNAVVVGWPPDRADDRIMPAMGCARSAPASSMICPVRSQIKEHVRMTEAVVLAQLPGCVASLAGSEPYTRKVIEFAAPKGLKVIARAGVGYDAVDLAAATEHGIAVCFAPGSNQDAVAEHAFMLI